MLAGVNFWYPVKKYRYLIASRRKGISTNIFSVLCFLPDKSGLNLLKITN
jgi:hypothetical protein